MDASTTSLDVSSFALDESLITSTPHKRTRPYSRLKSQSAFLLPKDPSISNCYRCERCRKVYKSARFYRDHSRSHVMKDAVQRKPTLDMILGESVNMSIIVLDGMLESTKSYDVEDISIFSLYVRNLKSAVSKSTWKEVCDKVVGEVVSRLDTLTMCLPSAYATKALMECDAILSDTEFREELLCLLEVVHPTDRFVLDAFACDFCLKMLDAVLALIFKMVQGSCDNNNVISDIYLSQEERQTVHYVAGSILKGFLKKCAQHPGSNFYKKIRTAIRTAMLESTNGSSCSASDREWTEKRSRGRLLFVNIKVFNFFLSLSELLRAVESADDNFNHLQIADSVYKSKCRFLWDEVVGSTLSEDDSLLLMRGMTKSFTNTYGIGVAWKHRNLAVGSKPTAPIALRHRVAPKL